MQNNYRQLTEKFFKFAVIFSLILAFISVIAMCIFGQPFYQVTPLFILSSLIIVGLIKNGVSNDKRFRSLVILIFLLLLIALSFLAVAVFFRFYHNS